MKKMKTWFTLTLCVLMSVCAYAQTETRAQADSVRNYEINGVIIGEYQGKVYLVKEEKMHGAQTAIDSCEVVNGKFRFTGEAPEYSVIYFVQSKDGQLAPVFLEPGRIVMNIRPHHFLGAETKGTINNNLWQLHQLQTKYWLDSILLATNTDWMRFGHGTPEVEDRNFKYRTNLQNSKKLNMERYMVKYYNDEAFAPFIMLFEMTHELSLDELKALRAQLHKRLENHPYTKELDEVIANKEFKVGIDAPAFSIKGMDGKEIELKNYLGKYVLIDFWASWCGPCRREMPNVVKLYKECKGKNFEIIGISLDNKADAWKKAVKDLKMTWPQGCDFEVWQSPIARKYNLSAVPYTILVNPEGKIEAIDLRGEELISTVKTLLKKKK
jgi:peroxiredoxin